MNALHQSFVEELKGMLGMDAAQLAKIDLTGVKSRIMLEILLGHNCGSVKRWCKLQRDWL